MFRPTKRQRTEQPPSWMDVEQVETMATPHGHVRLSVASDLMKELFMDRFHKEIILKYNYSLSNQLRIHDEVSVADLRVARRLLRDRIHVGINICTKTLMEACKGSSSESDGADHRRPRLVVLAADMSPPHLVQHVPLLAQQLKIPILLLSKGSMELGQLLGTKRVAVILFASADPPAVATERAVHDSVDSFVTFVLQKMQTV